MFSVLFLPLPLQHRMYISIHAQIFFFIPIQRSPNTAPCIIPYRFIFVNIQFLSHLPPLISLYAAASSIVRAIFHKKDTCFPFTDFSINLISDMLIFSFSVFISSYIKIRELMLPLGLKSFTYFLLLLAQVQCFSAHHG